MDIRLHHCGVTRTLKGLDLAAVNYKNLTVLAASMFALKPRQLFALQYRDEDQDLITASSDKDLAEALKGIESLKTPLDLYLKTDAECLVEGFDLILDFANPLGKHVDEKEPVVHPLLDAVLAEFVGHESLTDRSEVVPGEEIVKIWRVKNSGARPWPRGVRVVYVSGDACMKETAVHPLDKVVMPGEEALLAISISPIGKGRVTGFYRIQCEDQSAFGPYLWTDLVLKPIGSGSREDSALRSESCPPTFGKHDDSMKKLWDMGFKDTSVNLFLLEKFGGSVDQVISSLAPH